jgi:hypothetical protein
LLHREDFPLRKLGNLFACLLRQPRDALDKNGALGRLAALLRKLVFAKDAPNVPGGMLGPASATAFEDIKFAVMLLISPNGLLPVDIYSASSGMTAKYLLQ